MNNALLRIYAATVLDSILKADGIPYANMNPCALCSRIQEKHTEIEKEVAFAPTGVWPEIKKYERANVFRRIWLRMVQTLRNRSGSVDIPMHVLESIVDKRFIIDRIESIRLTIKQEEISDILTG